MNNDQLRVLILGAHPDDAEVHAGGLALIHAKLGNRVKMVSVTNGGAGHHILDPVALVRTRKQELAKSADRLGGECDVWDFPDGSLQPTLELREAVIREIRSFRPDLVLTHRTCDYHPDHRAVGQAVQDASYMVTVPLVVPDCPIPEAEPVVAYMWSIGHTIRPNGEVLEGNPADVDESVPQTRENFRDYYPLLLSRALEHLGLE